MVDLSHVSVKNPSPGEAPATSVFPTLIGFVGVVFKAEPKTTNTGVKVVVQGLLGGEQGLTVHLHPSLDNSGSKYAGHRQSLQLILLDLFMC